MQISQENQAGELSSAKPFKTLWCAGPIKGPTNRSGGSRADIHLQARDSAAIWAKTQARGDAAPSRLRRHGTGIGARARQVPPLQEILLRSLRRRYRRFRFLLFVHPGRPRRRAQRSLLSVSHISAYLCLSLPHTVEQFSRPSFIPCCCLELAPICLLHLIVWCAARAELNPAKKMAWCAYQRNWQQPCCFLFTEMQGESALLSVFTQQRN
jgi:hypothetical protein